MSREMSPRYINSLMKEPAGWQRQFEGAEKLIDVSGGGDRKLRLKPGNAQQNNKSIAWRYLFYPIKIICNI